ncbi:MAG TPA: GtrA family protein [Usitatibacteraceae bacterium]|nr:GtrA family protein [Usitatibacteraceae bacterium]
MNATLAEAGRFLRYGIAGLVATATHYAVMVALVWTFAGHEVLASSMGFIAGAFVKYPLNYWLVFASRQRHRVAVPRFVIGLALAFALNAVLLALLLRSLDAHYMVSQVLTTGVVIFANYVVARLWIFRHRPGTSGPGSDRR